MCLSIPGKIIEVGENYFTIDYQTEKRKIEISLIDVKVGDYVIVSNKIILAKVSEEKAIKFMELANGN